MPLDIGIKTETNVDPSSDELSGKEVNRIKVGYDFLEDKILNTTVMPPDPSPAIVDRLAALESLVVRGPSQLLKNTYGWWRPYMADLYLKDSSQRILRMSDFLTSGRSFISNTDVSHYPSTDGKSLILDGLLNRMFIPGAVLDDPFEVYMVVKIAPGSAGVLLSSQSGNSDYFGVYLQGAPADESRALSLGGRGSTITTVDAFPFDIFVFVKVICNGANSSIQFGDHDPTTGNYIGEVNGPLILGTYESTGGGDPATMELAELIIRTEIDTLEDDTIITNYCKSIATAYNA